MLFSILPRKSRSTVLASLVACVAAALSQASGVAGPIQNPVPALNAPLHIRSHLTIYDLRDRSIHVLYTADRLIQSPNWSRDGSFLLANSDGVLYRFNITNPTASPLRLGLDPVYFCNNDHGISPDSRLLAFSAIAKGASGSQVYLADADGSNPHLIVSETPSFYHGWSPDGRWIAFVSERAGNYDIYRIPAAGGPKQRLTSNPSHDDGPDYSADGKWIYINSDRSGSEQIWRFPADGAGDHDEKAEQITNDEFENWFPHPSPNGKWLVFLSFPNGTPGHNARVGIRLRMLPLKGNKIVETQPQVLAEFFGGQGTINVNSWSPDSMRFAFVSYEMLP